MRAGKIVVAKSSADIARRVEKESLDERGARLRTEMSFDPLIRERCAARDRRSRMRRARRPGVESLARREVAVADAQRVSRARSIKLILRGCALHVRTRSNEVGLGSSVLPWPPS